MPTPRRVAAAHACAAVFGMSWNLRSRNTLKFRWTIQRTGSGPATTNSSLPTLRPQAPGSSLSASASARIGFSKSSATKTRGKRVRIDMSGIAVGRFCTSWHVGLPFLAAGAAPVVLLGTKAALLAAVHAESLDVLRDESLDELEVVTAVG